MSRERLLTQVIKKSAPLVLVGLGLSSFVSMPRSGERCTLDVCIQVSSYKNASQTLIYDINELGKLDLARVGSVVDNQKFIISFSGNDKEFPVITDMAGRARIHVNLSQEGINKNSIYFLMQREGDTPVNKHVECGDKKEYKVLVPGQTENVTNPPTSTFTQIPQPAIFPTATFVLRDIPITIYTPTPEATRVPLPTATAVVPSVRESKQYPQCGGTCNLNTYPSTDTVMVTESINSDGTTAYSCSTLGPIPGQCGN